MSSNRKHPSSPAIDGAQPQRAARTDATTPEPLAFEEALGQLDEAVAALESGQLTLEDALRIFEEGVRLTQRCQQALDNAELRIQRLRARDDRDDEDMSPFALDDFEDDAQE
jgi:exodeoxyribonuclease VII small subunit